jgi:hypothetical protein
MTDKLWHGKKPVLCDLCGMHVEGKFYDARSRLGPWACMCVTCNTVYGVGKLGPGYGQEYTQRADGEFVKTDE